MTRRPSDAWRRLPVMLLSIGLLAACAGTPPESRSLAVRTANGSGVTGSVTLTARDDGTTRVTVDVDPAGHPNMPAHIHSGTCNELIPQPEFPLLNIVEGQSTTDLIVPLDELLRGPVALNLHASNDDMKTSTACVELR